MATAGNLAAAGAAAGAGAAVASGGRTYMIRGIPVQFPFDAYDCQLVYMEKVIESLQERKNALLESPTGTGKTLCLLCATLAWQQHQKNIERVARDTAPVSMLEQQSAAGATPRVIYASRTHSQLAQVIGELRNTAYQGAVRMSVLGSRQQLCVHERVSKMTGAHQNQSCRAHTRAHTCQYHETFQQRKGELAATNLTPRDVEDLVAFGTEQTVCPYYLSRAAAVDADLVLLPYNYLVDPHIRSQLLSSRALGHNSVVIFDEAHNLEGVCGDSASFDLTAATLANCIAEVQRAVMHTLDPFHAGADAGIAQLDVAALVAQAPGADRDRADRLLNVLKAPLLLLEGELATLPLREVDGVPCYTAPGAFIFELLQRAGITEENHAIVLDTVDAAITALFESDDAKSAAASADTVMAAAAASSRKSCALDGFRTCLQAVFRKSSNGFAPPSTSYRVFVHVPPPDRRGGRGGFRGGRGGGRGRGGRGFDNFSGGGGGGGANGAGAADASDARTLSYWCFSPGVAMSQLSAMLAPASVLLTSGTLSPLDSFAHELQLPFRVRLENPHVISNEQVWVGVIDKGPAGVKLNSSYQNRTSAQYIDDLGNAIVNFARIVPDGMLVFFPSYGTLSDSIEQWQRRPAAAAAASSAPGAAAPSSVWERIGKFKQPVVEPRGGSGTDFTAAMNDFDAKLRDANFKGAVFFAVMRGKVSEGLDFADGAARAVVITGLPYPMLKDPKVRLKREFLDSKDNLTLAAAAAAASAAATPGGSKDALRPISGREWYSQQATRAINQAIGRVIRHRRDYGAILLCDERFAAPMQKQQLSLWLRNRTQTFGSFGLAAAGLTKFFRHAKDSGWDRPLKAKKDKAARASGGAAKVDIDIASAADGGVSATAAAADAKSGGAGSGAANLNASYQSLVAGLNGAAAAPRAITAAAAAAAPRPAAAAAAAGAAAPAAANSGFVRSGVLASAAASNAARPQPVLAAATLSGALATAAAGSTVRTPIGAAGGAGLSLSQQLKRKRDADAAAAGVAGPPPTAPAAAGSAHSAARGNGEQQPSQVLSFPLPQQSLTPAASMSGPPVATTDTTVRVKRVASRRLTEPQIKALIEDVKTSVSADEYATFKACIHDLEALKLVLKRYGAHVAAQQTAQATTAKAKADADVSTILSRLFILFSPADRERLKYAFVTFVPQIYQSRYRETLQFTADDERLWRAAHPTAAPLAPAAAAAAAAPAPVRASAASAPAVLAPAAAAAEPQPSLRERLAQRMLTAPSRVGAAAGAAAAGGAAPPAISAADKRHFVEKVRILLPAEYYRQFKEIVRHLTELNASGAVAGARAADADPHIETLRQQWSSNLQFESLKRDFEPFVPPLLLPRYRAIMFAGHSIFAPPPPPTPPQVPPAPARAYTRGTSSGAADVGSGHAKRQKMP